MDSLYAQRVAALRELEGAQAERRGAEAAWAQARAQVDGFASGTELTAPFAGVVVRRHTDPGANGPHPWMTWQTEFLVDTIDLASYQPTRDDWGPIVVPTDRFFVMGDNRDESLDSRYWGFVDPASLKGKAVILYFSYDREAFGPVPVFNNIRWSRIGDRLR